MRRVKLSRKHVLIIAWTLIPTFTLIAYLLDRNKLLPDCWLQPVGTLDTTIENVIDGDTYQDACGYRIRLIGVDTPEVGAHLAEDATLASRALLLGQQVRLDICRKQNRDRYGRLLARVYVGGVDVAKHLLSEGLATVLSIPPCGDPYETEDRATLDAARTAQKGLWQTMSEPISAFQAKFLNYAWIRDRVVAVGETGQGIELYLGKDKAIAAVIPKRRVAAFLEAGIDPAKLQDVTITVEGKIVGKKKRKIILYSPKVIRF